MRLSFIGFLLLLAGRGTSAEIGMVKGFNLTEIGSHRYDAAEIGDPKTEAQKIVDRMYALGARHVALTPRGIMRTPYESVVLPITRPEALAAERAGYLRLIEYIHGKGMTVAIRPLLFVVDDRLNPFIELGRPLPPGVVWWHGNIQPVDVPTWFDSFKGYLDLYASIAKVARVEEFTIGAELHSMTVGFGDKSSAQYACGFPGEWVKLLAWLRGRLPGVRLMYDINFTDDAVGPNVGHPLVLGGEFQRWCQRLTRPDTGCPGDDLRTFWTGLDAIGIDFYRSLAAVDVVLTDTYPQLTAALRTTSDRFASQVDTCLFEIQKQVGCEKPLIIKDVGYRSIERGYLNPWEWVTPGGVYNEGHQAAAYEAVLQSFQDPRWPWYRGIVWWDVPVDLDRHGPEDKGFSPLGKPMTEAVLRKYFGP